ncbi:hypothetical protein HPB50_028568 [Hyalomma asiaticum]|nr:hypothetical protein HPB50_028568 [Hyalomma asiaticum]
MLNAAKRASTFLNQAGIIGSLVGMGARTALNSLAYHATPVCRFRISGSSEEARDDLIFSSSSLSFNASISSINSRVRSDPFTLSPSIAFLSPPSPRVCLNASALNKKGPERAQREPHLGVMRRSVSLSVAAASVQPPTLVVTQSSMLKVLHRTTLVVASVCRVDVPCRSPPDAEHRSASSVAQPKSFGFALVC